MRWKTEPPPKLGTVRVVKKFAWFPVEIGDTVVWLEKYNSRQYLGTTFSPSWGDEYVWIERNKELI